MASKGRRGCFGQSMVEAVVVIGLVAILAVSVIKGIGLQSASRLARANEVFDAPVARVAAAAGVRVAGPMRPALARAATNTTDGVWGQ